jgi:Family of unknown function (DUF5760)
MQNNVADRQISPTEPTATNKEQLIKVIKDWVKNDNEIRVLQNELRVRNQEKKKITGTLMEIMRNHEIDCFDINDGKILYRKKNIKQSITKSYLMNILSNFYQDDIEKANELNTFILSQRKITVKECIVRKITNQDQTP